MAEPVASALAPLILNPSVGFAEKHIGYVWNNKKNIAELKRQVEKLDAQRDDTSHSVTAAQRNAEKIKTRVQLWLDGACKTSQEARTILQEYEQLNKKICLMRCCPNPISLYQLGRRACKTVLEIKEAITEAVQISSVSVRAVGVGTSNTLATEGLLDFASRKSILEDIIKTLQEETMNFVGVYGFGGMGKTTLAKQIASRAAEEKMFEEVVMASVTQTVDMKEIQGQIASMLDLKLEESSVAERASRVHERLKGKKVLVILDDLWTRLDLMQVGIPFGAEHMGCKVLLTSRFLPVLSSMGTRKEYVLGALEEDEAWKLFEEKVIHIVKNPKFLVVGKEVAKRCAGLPILILTVAASLAKRPDLDAWNDALAQVKKMNHKNMHDIVNSAMQHISYENLNEAHKRLFLLCGLLLGDVEFEDMLKYSLGWDLLGEDSVVTMEGARNRLQTMIFDLKEVCLLLDGDARNNIKMHDVVRDLAISIARKDLNAFSIGYRETELSRWPKNDVINKCTAVVLRTVQKLPCFPERLECPSLELFILWAQKKGLEPTILDTFFERTSKLKVLDMTSMYFQTLPSSLSFLKDLQSLHLDYCDGLQDISIVGELKKLQVLSLIFSTIQELPSSLGQLSELKLLDLNGCSKLKVIPAGLIKNLSQLEELHMSRGSYIWESEECVSNSGRNIASFAELKCLRNLSYLRVELQDAKLLAEDLNFEKLKRYEIIVGDVWDPSFRDWFKNLKIKTSIALQLGTNSINHFQHVVNTLFKRTEFLCFHELKGINNFIPELNEDGFPELKHLRIVEDFEIQYIVNVEDKQHKAKASFPLLESLHLSCLRKVEKICNAGLVEGSFYNLTIVKVHDCNRLESLFSFSTIIALPYIEEIEVLRCGVLEEFVGKKRNEEDVNSTSDVLVEMVELAQLRKLALDGLPKFMTFFSGKKIPMVKRRQRLLTSEMESQEIISEEEMMKPEDESASSFPLFEEVSFPKLEELLLSELSNLTEIWSHRVPVMLHSNLTTLTVTNCDKLKYIFTPSHARVLVGLQTLIIKDCEGIKEVVAREEGERKTETIIFPQLSVIKLTNLPNLTTFYSGLVEDTTTREKVTEPLFGEKVQFPGMKELFIKNLDSLKAIWQTKVGTTQSLKNDSFRKLEFVSLISCRSLLKTFSSTMSTTTQNNLKDKPQELPIFPYLTEMTVNNCESLRFVFPAFVARSLNQLMEVGVEDCGVERIIGDDEDIKLEKLEAGTTTFTLPKLLIIKLKGLPKMECFYRREPTIECPALKELHVVDCDKLYDLGLIQKKANESRIQEAEPYILSINGVKVFSLTGVTVAAGTSFEYLSEIEIKGCGGLKYLFTTSIAMALEKVHKLTISKCSMMKAIVGTEREEATDRITFRQLIHLSLGDVPNLTRFCSPVEEMDSNEKFDDSDVQPHLFNEKMQFPRLKKLYIASLDKISNLWQSHQLYEAGSFCRLEEVIISSCANLLTIFPSKINSKDESQEVLIFQNLTEVTVEECESLKHVFTASMARSLNQLKEVTVQGCGVETIIDDDEDEIRKVEDQVTVMFTFSNLVTVNLYRLPKLKSFYPRDHIIDWPTLEKLNVVYCGKFSALDFIDFTGKQGNHQIIKVISSLKCLSLRSKELSILLGLCYLFQLRLSLKDLLISEFYNELSSFPSKFLSLTHYHLQLFHVSNCSFHEIFPYEGDVTDHNDDALFPQLRSLKLRELSELEYICKQDQYSSLIRNILERLEDLTVLECPRLTNLVPPFVSFKLLKKLWIENCDGLVYLFQPSTATSMEQLEYLSISECEMIEEIIEGEVRDEHEDGIIFNKLRTLYLQKLPRLTNFCSSRNYNFNFPELKLVWILKCSNMKTFSGGITTAPNSNTVVYSNEYKSTGELWGGDLNIIVEKIYEEMEAARSATTLPSISPTNHSEAQALEERVAATHTFEKSKGKEVEVPEQAVEHFEKSETPQYSDASCSNYTASSSQLAQQMSNHPDEDSHLASQVEAHTPAATVSTTSSNNQFETKAQIHDMSPEKSIVEPEKESQILRNYFEELGNKESEVCENVTMGPRNENGTSDQVDAQGLTLTLPSTSSSGQIIELTEPTKEDRISKHAIDELGNQTEVSEKSTKLRNESTFCDNVIEPKQVTKISPCLETEAETGNFIPLIRESVRALEAQPMSSLNAEHVHFVKKASDWFCAYANKATKLLERNNEISDLKREIAEKELKVRALQDENEASSSSMPSFE